MKKFNFDQNVLAAGVALALGITINASASTGLDGSNASTNQVGTGVKITNTANATYSVDGVPQTPVTSNPVIVNISEVASFTLFATQNTPTDDKNENQVATPGNTTTFTNTLKNTGNVADTYTINITQNDDPSITTANQDYAFTGPTVINYTIINADGSPGTSGTITSGQTIQLQAGQSANLSYDLTTPTTAINGQNGVGTITATSAYINAKDATKATLVNENHAVVTTPVFSIVKSAATNIDLNTANSITYTIKVKNDGSVDATNILVQDNIDSALSLADTSATNIKVTGIADTTYSTTGSAANLLKVSGIDLKAGETATITFTVNITNKATLAKKGSLTNNADVYDNYDASNPDPTNPQIWDSTDPTKTDTPHVPDTQDPNATDPNNPGVGGDAPSTVYFTQRALTLTADQSAEVPNTSTANTNADFTPVITNTGANIEGDTAGEVTFKLIDTTTGNNLNINGTVTITYDPTPNSPNSGDEVVNKAITPDANGVYDINSALPGGIAPGGKVTINYSVDSNNAATGTVDKVTVQLIPGGFGAPAGSTVTDTTTVKGMKLEKFQALDANCNGTISGSTTNPDGTTTTEVDFTTTDINTAIPGQCIIYKIVATNSFTNYDLTDVVIKDEISNWSGKATYQSGTDSANVTATNDGTNIKSSALTIPKNNGTGWLQFSIKIKS